MSKDGNDIRIEIGLHGDAAVVKGFQKVGQRGQAAGGKVDKSFKKAGATVGSFNKQMIGQAGMVAGITAAVYASRQLIAIADGWTLVEGRLKLVTKSSAQLAQVQGDLFELSQNTRSSYEATADLYTRLARSTAQLGKSDKDLLAVTEAVNKSLIVSGASAQESNASIIQLGQGLASGALRGDELRSVLEQTPRLAQAIAEGMGVPIGKLRDLGKAGELTTEAVFAALLKSSGKIQSEFEQMPTTVGQAMTKINNSFGKFINGSDKSLTATETLAGGLGNVAEAIDDLSGPVANIMGMAKSSGGALGLDTMDMGIIGLALIGGGPGAAALVYSLMQANKLSQKTTGKSLLGNFNAANGITDLRDQYATRREAYQETARLRQLIADKEAAWENRHAIARKKAADELAVSTRTVAETDRKLLAERLKEHEGFYKELGNLIEANARKEIETLKELNGLYLQQMDLRRSTEGMLAGLGGGPQRSDADQYSLTRSELDQQYQSAMTLGGQDQIDALEKYKTAINSLAQEFKAGFSGTEGSEITTQAINDIQRAYEVQKEVMAGLTTASGEQLENTRLWGEELTNELGWAGEGVELLKTTLAELDGQIQKMDRTLTMEADDRATRVIYDIQREVDRLHDKTITITTRQVTTYSDSQLASAPPLDSYAVGTDWVPKTGLYQLHQGEAVVTAAENRAARAGGGGTSFGDIVINIPAGAAPQSPADYRQITRDFIVPELEAMGRG